MFTEIGIIIVILIVITWVTDGWLYIRQPYHELKEFLGPPSILDETFGGGAIWRNPTAMFADVKLIDVEKQPITASMQLEVFTPVVTQEQIDKIRTELRKVPGVSVDNIGLCKFRAQTSDQLLHITRWVDKITHGRPAQPEPKTVGNLRSKVQEALRSRSNFGT